MVRPFLILAALVASVVSASAHSWYSERIDPVYHNSCCGGTDCAMWSILPGELTREALGYRIKLTVEHAAKIDPYRQESVNGFVLYQRVQDSPDNNWHLCIPPVTSANQFMDVYCLFAPPST